MTAVMSPSTALRTSQVLVVIGTDAMPTENRAFDEEAIGRKGTKPDTLVARKTAKAKVLCIIMLLKAETINETNERKLL